MGVMRQRRTPRRTMQARKERNLTAQHIETKKEKLGKMTRMTQTYFLESWLLSCSLRSHHTLMAMHLHQDKCMYSGDW